MPVIVAGFLVVGAPIDKLVWFFIVVHTLSAGVRVLC